MPLFMTAQQKQTIIQQLKMLETTSGQPLRYAKIPQILSREHNISWRDYAGSVSFPTWLNNTLGVQQLDEHTFSFFPAISICRKTLNACFEERDRILLSDVPQLLAENAHIQYKNISGGLALKPWLETWIAPDFRFSVDNIALEKNTTNTSVMTLSKEATQMQALAYGRWDLGCLNLSRCTGLQNINATQCRDAIAHAMAVSFLGMGGGLMKSSDDAEPKFAFHTGYQTHTGAAVYCILSPNSLYPHAASQPWIIKGFSYPGETDARGWGAWLSGTLSSSGNTQDSLPDVGDLYELLEQIELSRASLIGQLSSFQNAVTDGHPLNDDFLKAIDLYQSHWATFKQLLPTFSWLELNESSSLSDVKSLLDSKTSEQALIGEALNTFFEIADQTYSYLQSVNAQLPENATPCRDKEIAQRLLLPVTESGLQQFNNLLDCYHALKFAMSSEYTTTPEVMDAIDVISMHFPELSKRFIGGMLVHVDETEWQYLNKIESIRHIIDNIYQDSFSNPSTPDATGISADDIFACYAAEDDGAAFSAVLAAAPSFPADLLETHIAHNDFAAAAKLLQNADTQSFPDLTQTQIAEICRAATESPEELSGYSFCEVGMRLYHFLGNRNHTAEKYFLVGLKSHPAECLHSLLLIYHESENDEKFSSLCLLFEKQGPLSPEEQDHLLTVLAKQDSVKLEAYLKNHIYLLNLHQTLRTVLRAGQGVLDPNRYETLNARMEILAAHETHNFLEKAIIDNSKEKVIDCLASARDLEALGYSEHDLGMLRSAVMSEYPVGSSNYDIGARLYAFQGNKHRTAETFLWRAVAYDGANERCCDLLLALMATEQRWEECLDLYHAYPSLCISADAINNCMLAMVNHAPESSMEYIRNNLQNCMALLSSQSRNHNAYFCARVDALRSHETTHVSEFFAFLCRLQEHMENNLIRSIVLQSVELREFVIQSDTLSAFGMDASGIERLKQTFKANQYDHGSGGKNIAQRLYALIGTYHETAKLFAEFVLTYDETAALLMWRILDDTNDKAAQYDLLNEYPLLQEKHQQEYRQFLFCNHEYQRFDEQLSTLAPEELSTREKLQLATARSHTGRQWEDLFAEDSLDLSGVEPDWIIELLDALEKLGENDAAKLLVVCFEAMLSVYSAAELIRITSIDGQLSPERKSDYQSYARSKCTPLALYYYNVQHIGEMTEQMQHWIDANIERLTWMPASAQIDMLRPLLKVFANTHGSALELHTLRAVQTLIGDQGGGDLTNLLALLRDATLSPAALREVFELLTSKGTDISLALCKDLYTIFTAEQIDLQTILLFHRSLQPKAEKDKKIASFLCRIYMDAFQANVFPAELLEEAEQFCKQALNLGDMDSALYCLYQIETALGKKISAEVTLLILCHRCNDEEICKLGAAISAEIWQDGAPSLYELFCVAMQFSLKQAEEFAAYCEILCKQFANPHTAKSAQPLPVEMEEATENAYWSEYLYLLFSSSDSGFMWERLEAMPLEENPKIYSRILYLICIKNPQKESLRNKCIDYFEHHSDNEDLLEVLLQCVLSVPVPYTMRNLRGSLAQKLNTDGTYFSRWKNNPKLVALMAALCDRVGNSDNPSIVHASLKDLSAIVIASESEEAFHHLIERYGQQFLTEYAGLGVAVVCRLLLSGRVAEAESLIKSLHRSNAVLKYEKLITELSSLTVEDLSAWIEQEDHQLLLQLILPSGNNPTIEAVRSMTLDLIVDGKHEIGAKVLCKLLDYFPSDYAAYDCLFMLCKKDFPGKLPVLHRALCGLIRNKPGTSASYYHRRPSDYAKMLAKVNAVILGTGQTSCIAQSQAYSFEEKAGSYYHKWSMSTSPAEVSELNELQDAVLSSFANHAQQQIKALEAKIICEVTEDWTTLIYTAWQNRNISGSLPVEFDVSSRGFLRSALRVTYSLDADIRHDFVEWITSSVGDDTDSFISRYKMLCEDYQQISAELIDGSLFDYPMEEYSMLRLIGANTILQIAPKAPGQVASCVRLMAHLVNYPNAYSEFVTWGLSAFDADNDDAAYGYFSTLHQLRKQPVFSRPKADPRIDLEKSEALCRLSGLFIGNEEIMQKVSDPEFNVWSCINLVLALITTKRADEVRHLQKYLHTSRQPICDAILKIIDPHVSEKEKRDLVLAYSDQPEKSAKLTAVSLWLFMCSPIRLPAHGTASETTTHTITDRRYLADLRRVYSEICQLYPSEFHTSANGKLQFRHTLLTKDIFSMIDPSVYHQKENFRQAPTVRASETIRNDVTPETLPSFAKNMEETPVSVPDLSILTEQYNRCDVFDYDTRYQLAKECYQFSQMSDTCSSNQKMDMLIRLGVAHYNFHAARKDDSQAIFSANRGIKELMRLRMQNVKTSEDYKKLVQLVRTTALHGMLYREHKTIRTMVEDYRQFRDSFIHMRDMLSDSLKLECVNLVYSVLDRLVEVYTVSAAPNSQFIQEELTKAYGRFNNPGTGWPEIQNKVRNLIHEEIDVLSRRPELLPVILNHGKNGEVGSLFGMIRNIGRETAVEITIQARFGDGKLSKRYQLKSLAPGSKAAFDVEYSVAPGVTALEYELITSYKHKSEYLNAEAIVGTLDITDEPAPVFPATLYSTDAVMNYSVTEDGEVFSPDFYGRDSEKRKVAEMFQADDFFGYKNVLIRGIKRSGKTSLLYYLEKYAKAKCSDAIVVYRDCESVTTNIIYTIFVESVLNAIHTNYPNITHSQDWLDFAAKWQSEEKKSNFIPDELQYFYPELKRQTGGKGLILIVDEIDTAFGRLAKLDSSVFPALRALMNTRSARESVHLVFCGSNELIRFEEDGGELTQLFQMFADNVIEVGRLPEEDTREMLQKPYADKYPHVVYTPEALQCIWECTGGLVWYTKLLGREILRSIQEDNGRSVIYPSDVYTCLHSILQDGYFKQIQSGARPGERLVIEAIQSLTSSAVEYVSFENILRCLGPDISQPQLEKDLNTLVSLQLLERKTTSQNQYRFSVTLYWYYFRQCDSHFNINRKPAVELAFEECIEDVYLGAAEHFNTEHN